MSARNYRLTNSDGTLNSKTYCDFYEIFKKNEEKNSMKTIEDRTAYITVFDINNMAVILEEDYIKNKFSENNLSIIGNEKDFKITEKEIKLHGFELERIVKDPMGIALTSRLIE